MRQVSFRIITEEFNSNAYQQTAESLRNTLADIGIHGMTEPVYIPYWKNTRLGELAFQCTAAIPLSQIQKKFATVWKTNTTDSRWSAINIPSVCFLWISK